MEKTANQNIRPVTFKRNKNGNIEIGGCDIALCAQKFGTPLIVYDEDTIIKIISEYKKAFEGLNINFMYAAKAFMTKAICKIMQREGFGLDCVSGGEIYTAKSAGFDMTKILFNGNNKSRDEIKFALSSNVGIFSVDNFYEAEILNEEAGKARKIQNIFLRINPETECHTHEYIKTGQIDSKFGFNLKTVNKITDLTVSQYKNLNLTGFHVHLGSQIFETEVFKDAIKVLFEQANILKNNYGIGIKTFNIGGGAGIKYTEEDTPFSIYEYGNAVKEAIKKYSEEYKIENPKIYIEPGRSIIATAGVSIYSVGSSKEIPEINKKYLSVDGGMGDNIRPALYGAKYTVEPVFSKYSDITETITISGKYCESGDILAKDINLPNLTFGDLICFYVTGAYGCSMSSNYNKNPRPAVILVKDGKEKLIVRRETYEDLILFDEIPSDL